MLAYEDGCVDCGRPCYGRICPHRRTKVLLCDCCEAEVERLYIVDGEQLCFDCAVDELMKNVTSVTAEDLE